MSVTDFPLAGTIGSNLLPKRYDIVIYQGDTFTFNVVLKDSLDVPLDVTGWTPEAQIKKVSDNTPAETPNLTAVAGTTDGKITVTLSGTGSSALYGATEYKYDLQVTDTSGNVRTFLGGKITVTEDVTE